MKFYFNNLFLIMLFSGLFFNTCRAEQNMKYPDNTEFRYSTTDDGTITARAQCSYKDYKLRSTSIGNQDGGFKFNSLILEYRGEDLIFISNKWGVRINSPTYGIITNIPNLATMSASQGISIGRVDGDNVETIFLAPNEEFLFVIVVPVDGSESLRGQNIVTGDDVFSDTTMPREGAGSDKANSSDPGFHDPRCD